MDLIKRMNKALEYIESNLENEIKYRKIAQIALSSEYHFSRMFSAITGVNLSEYIRRRCLTKAAFDLQHSNQRILDIAVRYGYNSADSFSRAFYRVHGVKPSVARIEGVELKVYPKISFQITIKGVTDMQYRIEKKNKLKLIGKTFKVKTAEAFTIVPELWNQAHETGLVTKLLSLAWQDNPNADFVNLLGVCGEVASIKDEQFNYFIAVQYEGIHEHNLETLELPATAWAVFDNVIDAWNRVYVDWLPNSNYELANCPCIECYYPPNHKKDSELWLPVVKSNN